MPFGLSLGQIYALYQERDNIEQAKADLAPLIATGLPLIIKHIPLGLRLSAVLNGQSAPTEEIQHAAVQAVQAAAVAPVPAPPVRLTPEEERLWNKVVNNDRSTNNTSGGA